MRRIMRRSIGLALVLALLAALVLPATAMAQVFPCTYWGYVTVNDNPVDPGTTISAWIAGEQVASILTGTGTLPDNGYTLTVEREAPPDPNIVRFKIGDLWADQTSTWEATVVKTWI